MPRTPVIGINSKLDTPLVREVLNTVLSYGDEIGTEFVITPHVAEMVGGSGYRGKAHTLASVEDFKTQGVDYIITIGGDGTILYTLQRADSIPVLGINCGGLGFLTTVEPEGVKTAINRLISGDFYIDERARLGVELNGERLYDCTNEAVVHTSQISKIQRFALIVDGNEVSRFGADGVIIATPTGSTCYAMSAGGPIVSPYVKAFIIVPIAPFKLSSRPLIISQDADVRVEVIDARRPCLLVLDGQEEFEVGSEDTLRFFLSKSHSRFVRFKKEKIIDLDRVVL